MSNTRDSVSWDIQTARISPLKTLRCAWYFQLSSRCFDIPMKHCLSCLIYYIKPYQVRSTTHVIRKTPKTTSNFMKSSVILNTSPKPPKSKNCKTITYTEQVESLHQWRRKSFKNNKGRENVHTLIISELNYRFSSVDVTLM